MPYKLKCTTDNNFQASTVPSEAEQTRIDVTGGIAVGITVIMIFLGAVVMRRVYTNQPSIV